MERWQNKVAVVTGASCGIGAAIAKDLVVAGLNVIGLARRRERIEELKQTLTEEQQKRLHAFKCDVRSLDSVNLAFDWIEEQFGGIDILVNNAGIVRIGQLATLDPHQIENVLQTNVMGVVYCTQRAFKSMKERNFDGHVILINSVSGHIVPANQLPVCNIYSPSKFAITAMTEIYREEFVGLETKVKITSVSPGAVDTEIAPDDIVKALGRNITLRPEDVSQAVLYAMGTPPHVQINELTITPLAKKA